MAKFGLTYILALEPIEGDSIEISMPFSIDFSVSRSMTGGANTANFTIYNLNEDTQNKIYKDPFVMEFRAIQLFAGYDDDVTKMLPMLFNGQIKGAYSMRQGTEFRTEIEAFDGAFAMTQGNVNQAQSAGQTLKETMLGMMNSLPKIEGATVGKGFDQKTQRGQVLMGNPAEYLKMLSSNRFFIDKNHAYVLADDEVLEGDIETIDASTGLIGTPKKSGQVIEVELIFEPRITLAQSLELISETNKAFSGVYKVIEVVHSGTISPSVSSNVTTKLKLYNGSPYVLVNK